MCFTISYTVENSRLKFKTYRILDSLSIIYLFVNFLRAIFYDIRERRSGWIYSNFIALNIAETPIKWISFVS